MYHNKWLFQSISQFFSSLPKNSTSLKHKMHESYNQLLDCIAASFLFTGLSGDFIHSLRRICLSCDNRRVGCSVFNCGNLTLSKSSYAAFIRFSGCLSTESAGSFILEKEKHPIRQYINKTASLSLEISPLLHPGPYHQTITLTQTILPENGNCLIKGCSSFRADVNSVEIFL